MQGFTGDIFENSDSLTAQRQHIARVASNGARIQQELTSGKPLGIDVRSYLAYLQVQVNRSRAARIAHEADDGAFLCGRASRKT